MEGKWENIRLVEVIKAVESMSSGKAAGPDGAPVEIYKEMPALWEKLRVLFDCLLEKGVIPAPLLLVHLVPLAKLKKGPENCSSKRQVSLHSPMAKILEAVIHNRLFPRFEPWMEPRQYAYRRGRSTEMHLQELMDFAQNTQRMGWPVYLASIDVGGAFGKVPHASPLATFEKSGVGGFYCRYLFNWLVRRRFQIRLNTPNGEYYSKVRSIGRGLPQGGVISPFLWLVHTNGLIKGMSKRRMERTMRGKGEGAMYYDAMFADDIITAITHPALGVAKELSVLEAEEIPQDLAALRLRTETAKSQNFIIAPGTTVGKAFRRIPDAYKRGDMQVQKRDDTLELMSKQVDPVEGGRLAEYDRVQEGLPYKVVEEMKILGVTLDKRMSFRGHVAQILEKVQARLAILRRLAGCKWGAETGILRLSGEALIISLLRYCITIVGTGVYEKDLGRLEVCALNVLARRVAGVSRAARIPVLHAAAGLLSVRNLYVQQCAALLDRSLRAVNSWIQERMEQWTEEQYGVTGWKAEALPLEMGAETGPGRVYRMPFFDLDLQEGWFFCVLEKTPRLLPQHRVASTFFTEAAESEVNPSLKETTYNFENTRSWMDVGLQVLQASGWRPDCAVPHTDNIGKMLPPADPRGLLLAQSPTNWGLEDQALGEVGYNKWMMGELRFLRDGGIENLPGTPLPFFCKNAIF